MGCGGGGAGDQSHIIVLGRGGLPGTEKNVLFCEGEVPGRLLASGDQDAVEGIDEDVVGAASEEKDEQMPVMEFRGVVTTASAAAPAAGDSSPPGAEEEGKSLRILRPQVSEQEGEREAGEEAAVEMYRRLLENGFRTRYSELTQRNEP